MASKPRVVVSSGHMVDTPDRTPPRFPPDQVGRVTREVRAILQRWAVGPGTTIVNGGARGADIIVAEEALARGARSLLCLALPPDDFEKRSVTLPGSDWVSRFRSLLEASSEVRVLADEIGETPDEEDLFARTNEWIVRVARSFGEEPPHALIVWNGQEGDGPGGTRDFVRRLGHEKPDATVRVIDPTPRAYEARQASDGPKKLLALDGGGIRGALSLEILRSLETRLRRHYGDGLVLADYFDYIGGTSTGAIIAAGLSLGKQVAELQESYRTLGGKVFRRRLVPMWWKSMYRDGRLTEELERMLGEGLTLGDPKLQSILLLVLHNTNTDSPWPVSNCTAAKYNRADRYLNTPSDRNLDIPLTALVRGSTAAPVYFRAQELDVGSNRFVFQDGGITPFNNPALLMFIMATLPEYGLEWPVGEERLLIVSVGTGSAPSVHPDLMAKKINLLFNARNLPSVFMNGASTAQDLLCRSLGRCLAGDEIDREFGARIDATGVAGSSLFTYLRYNADLSDGALIGLAIANPRERKRLRKLDAVKSIKQLEALGRNVGEKIDLDRHFGAFL